MNYLRRLHNWWRELLNSCREPWPDWDDGYPDSEPIPDMECPDTQPTSPGALDSDHARLK